MSTSIPSTCHKNQNVDNILSEYDPEPNLLSRITHPVNLPSLQQYNFKMLHQICSQYEIIQKTATIESLLMMTKNNTLPQTTHIAMFFLFLNIDLNFKHALINKEEKLARNKLCTFFQALRMNLISEFLINEAQSIDVFSTLCQEEWKNS